MKSLASYLFAACLLVACAAVPTNADDGFVLSTPLDTGTIGFVITSPITPAPSPLVSDLPSLDTAPPSPPADLYEVSSSGPIVNTGTAVLQRTGRFLGRFRILHRARTGQGLGNYQGNSNASYNTYEARPRLLFRGRGGACANGVCSP